MINRGGTRNDSVRERVENKVCAFTGTGTGGPAETMMTGPIILTRFLQSRMHSALVSMAAFV